MSNHSQIPSEHTLSQGTILHDNYIIERVLGEGGFGITYFGTCIKTNKAIAIKEFFPSGIATRTMHDNSLTVSHFEGKLADSFNRGMHRFLNEANLLKEFQNLGSIVSVFDVFEENGTAYIVMEYIEGITLKQLIDNEGPLPFDEMLSLFKPVLFDLHEVHKKGLIHRDISPDNLIVGMDNHLHLIDFGAASFENLNETKTMTVILKSGYAPPEQYISDGRIGGWTDVYGICATMYMVLNGVKPMDSIRRMQEDSLDFVEGHSSLKEYQKNGILRGLRLNYAERFSSTKLLYQALTTEPMEEIAQTMEATVSEQVKSRITKLDYRKRKQRQFIIITIMALLCVLLAIGLWKTADLKQQTQSSTQSNSTQSSDNTTHNETSNSNSVRINCETDYIELTIGEEITYDNQLELHYTIDGEYPSTAIAITETFPLDLLYTGAATDVTNGTYYAYVYPYHESGEGYLRTSLIDSETGHVYATHSIPIKINEPTDGIYPDYNKELLTMINTVGMTLEKAQEALAQLDKNIEITVVEEYNSEMSSGIVISQSILENTQFSYGQITQIQLVVSKGPAPVRSNNSGTQKKDDDYTTIHLE